MFNWNDELVIEYIQIYGSNTSHLDEFKNNISFIPENVEFLQVIKDNETIDISNNILRHYLNKEYKIYSLISNDVKFTLGDTIYNEKQKKRDGGKWNAYAIKIESFDVCIKEMCGVIVSSILKINNFYDLNGFIKR